MDDCSATRDQTDEDMLTLTLCIKRLSGRGSRKRARMLDAAR